MQVLFESVMPYLACMIGVIAAGYIINENEEINDAEGTEEVRETDAATGKGTDQEV